MTATDGVNWLVRFKLAEQQIIGARLTGNCRSDEESFRAAGFEDEAQFWEVAFSERMTADAFAKLMGAFFYEPSLRKHTRDLTITGVRTSISQASDVGEDWVSKPDAAMPGHFSIEPWKAAKWLATKPKRAHLIPESLKAFLCKDQQVDKSSTRKPGPKAIKMPKVVEAMRNINPERLSSMKLIEMAAEFDAGQTLCADARNLVLAELRNSKQRETANTEK